MSDNKKGNYPFPPSVPPPVPSYDPNSSYIPNRPPPPTYEESQMQNLHGAPSPASVSYFNNNIPSPYPQMNNGYGHGSNYMQQQQIPIPQRVVQPHYTHPPSYGSQMTKGTPPVVEFDAGARFNGRGSGSVRVPPPPPGCLPTPGQMAALQGQQVILKKNKNSFF